jgi:NADPH-dependent 2,4-dienoyl-CoA reductase/sulfur reductase-like enzyme
VVIVGAGPAGLATARSYRACGGRGGVTLIGEESVAPYRRPPLSKELLRGELEASEISIERDSWFVEQRISLRLGASVAAIDPERGSVSIDGGDELLAGAIVLATGSVPLRPRVDGAGDERVLTLRTLADATRLIERSEYDGEGHAAVVVGTGFIGCEVAASLALRGVEVSLVGQDQLPQEQRLGEAVGERVAGWLSELGVKLRGGRAIERILDGRRVVLADGEELEGAHVVLATGARPRSELAQDAALPLREGAIEVDASMRTLGAPERVLAVGDVAMAFNATAGRSVQIEHWGDALEQGEIAGRTLAGTAAEWRSVPGFWSQIGGHTIKYSAWGDGFDETRCVSDEHGGFTVWYGIEGATVGVLSHERDEDYERGRELIARGAPLP